MQLRIKIVKTWPSTGVHLRKELAFVDLWRLVHQIIKSDRIDQRAAVRRGHSKTKLTRFWSFLTAYLPLVDIFKHFMKGNLYIVDISFTIYLPHHVNIVFECPLTWKKSLPQSTKLCGYKKFLHKNNHIWALPQAVPIENIMKILVYLQILFGATYSFPTISNDNQPVCEEDLSNKGKKYSQFYNYTLSLKRNVKYISVWL